MSSETQIAVVLSHISISDEFRRVAKREWANWVHGTLEVIPPSKGDRWYYTDQAVNAFFDHAATGNGIVDGSQGTIFTFGYCGNYIDNEEFVHALEPFMSAYLKEDMEYAQATFFFHHYDMTKTEVWRIDGSKDQGYKVGEFPFTFEVDLRTLPSREH